VPAVTVKRGRHPQEVGARSRSIQCCEERVVKDLSIPVQDCPNGGVSVDRDLNARLNLLKRTVGQPFAAGGGLVDAQPVRQNSHW
jgi:transposase